MIRAAREGDKVTIDVTLERRPDRWQSARRNLAARGIHHVIKAPAVDGLALSQARLSSLLSDPAAVERPLTDYLQMTRPAVGCYLSHLAIFCRGLGVLDGRLERSAAGRELLGQRLATVVLEDGRLLRH